MPHCVAIDARKQRGHIGPAGLRKSLLNGAHLAHIFDSVKLTSMRKRSGLDGANLREFSLEGLGAEVEEEL